MSALYDVDVLNGLQELLEDDFIELIETYLRDVKLKVPQLNQFAQSNDYDSLLKVAHSLKGSSVNLGVGLFSKQCGMLEQLARNQTSDEIPNLVSQATEESTRLINALSSLYLE